MVPFNSSFFQIRPAMKINKLQNPSALLVVIPLLIYLFYSISYITLIGLNYDEAIFVNAALGGINDELIFKRIFGIPFMVLPDQGAIKSYLYYPIFKLFGVNVLSIRIPSILLSAATLFLWFKMANKILRNNYLSVLFIMLLATDPAYILHTKIDTSPVAIQNFLMVLTLYCYQSSFEQKGIFNISVCCFAIIFGLINKINFIWFSLAFCYVVVLYNRDHIFMLYKQNRSKFAALLVFFITALTLITALLIIPPALHYPIGGMTQTKLSEKIFFVINLYLQSLDGAWRYQSIFQKPLVTFFTTPSIVNSIEISCMILWLASVGYVRFAKINNETYQQYKKAISFFLMLFIIEFMFMLFTPHTYTPGHVMVLWPLPHFLFILMLAAIASLFHRSVVVLVVSQLPTIAVIFSQCCVNHAYNVAFSDPKSYRNLIWSPVIYQLSEFVNQESSAFDNVISVDAGTQIQLFALAKNNKERLKFHEFWFLFTDVDYIRQCVLFASPTFNRDDAVNQQWVYDNYYKGKRNLIVMLTTDELRHHAKKHFIDFTVKHHIQLKPVTTIADARGKATYSLFIATG